MTHPIVRWQLVTPDPDGAAQFFGGLFGWSVTGANAIGYREVATGDGSLAGGIWPAPPGASPFVQLFVAVPDVADSIRKAEELGGKAVVPRTVLPDGDVMAVVQDPTGLTVGLATLRER